MNEIYSPPESDLTKQESVNKIEINRPRAVTAIAVIFLILAIVDLIYRICSGFLTETIKFDTSGNQIGTGVRFQILWLVFYGVGAGLMRRGQFARGFASFLGLVALVIPGALIIYYLYFSPAKEYFNTKRCPECGGEKWKNVGFGYRKQACKKCNHEIKVKFA